MCIQKYVYAKEFVCLTNITITLAINRTSVIPIAKLIKCCYSPVSHTGTQDLIKLITVIMVQKDFHLLAFCMSLL